MDASLIYSLGLSTDRGEQELRLPAVGLQCLRGKLPQPRVAEGLRWIQACSGYNREFWLKQETLVRIAKKYAIFPSGTKKKILEASRLDMPSSTKLKRYYIAIYSAGMGRAPSGNCTSPTKLRLETLWSCCWLQESRTSSSEVCSTNRSKPGMINRASRIAPLHICRNILLSFLAASQVKLKRRSWMPSLWLWTTRTMMMTRSPRVARWMMPRNSGLGNSL